MARSMTFPGQIGSYNDSEHTDQTDPIRTDLPSDVFRPNWNDDLQQELEEKRVLGMQDFELEVPISNPLCTLDSTARDRSSRGDAICPQYEQTFNVKGKTPYANTPNLPLLDV